ncbi:hypothetical protein BOX15_Mlig013705g1 [Macrostomum lignano]|uniref:N-acetyltransferase domain-containing protein n=1 Tax=Macrostomum lignano TaxID=282301 RepID=A0A267FTR2_9PLAT|nr:hypothetical protein BOX15_Mlig013705g2 [Macrostomum lignano]PAA77157.1 hypothetical protein BOX15_Mlig013705g1 [Macrostomum lignano]
MKKIFNRQADGLVYRTATPADAEPVWKLMATQFHPRTALCPFLGMDFPADVEFDRLDVLNILDEGVSLLVEDPATGQVIGARLSSIERREDGNQKHPLVADPEQAAKYPKYSIIFRMFDQLTGDIDLFQRYNADTVMAFKFLVVSDSHAGRGIAKRLVQFSLEVAKDWQLQVTSVITGNKYSERIYDGLKFDRLNVLHIPDFVDPVDGSRPFEKLQADDLENVALYAKKL